MERYSLRVEPDELHVDDNGAQPRLTVATFHLWNKPHASAVEWDEFQRETADLLLAILNWQAKGAE